MLEFKVVTSYNTKDEVLNKDLKLGNGVMLSHYLDDEEEPISFPFVVFEYNGDFWVTDKENDVNEYDDEYLKACLTKLHYELGWI